MSKSETWDMAMEAFKRINALPDIAAQRIAFIQAIGDAEQRGAEQERERCAKKADDYLMTKTALPVGHIVDLAAAIRKGDTP